MCVLPWVWWRYMCDPLWICCRYSFCACHKCRCIIPCIRWPGYWVSVYEQWTFVNTALLCGLILKVLGTPLLCLLCGPLARVVLWGTVCWSFLTAQSISLLKQGFTHSPVFSDLKVFLGKGFAVRVLGSFLLCFYPCGLWAWWQESSFNLWHRDPHLIHELNLCLSIYTGFIPIVFIVLSSEVGFCTRYASYLFPFVLDLIWLQNWLI